VDSGAGSRATRRLGFDGTPVAELGRRRLRLASRISGFDLVVFMAFAALSVWVLVLVLAHAIGSDRSWTGTDGVGLQDQMQYVAWIRDASRHVLASNLFVLAPTPHDYLQPLVAISGLFTALGVAPWLTLLLWKPVAVCVVFLAIRAYVRRVLVGVGGQRAATVLAVFFVGPGQLVAQVLRHFGNHDFPWHDVTLDPWIGWWSWGYPFGLMALGAMLAALVVYSRERGERAVRLSPLLAALASWLHPWQGATLIVILVICELGEFARTRVRPRVRQFLLTSLGGALPLVYYVVLARTDQTWELGRAASSTSWPLWALALCELPLALPAALAYTSRPRSFLNRATLVWPVAAVAVFLVSETDGGFALHAFLGVNVPLAVLAVQGWCIFGKRSASLRQPALAWLAVGILVLPALADQLRWANQTVSASAQAPPPGGHGDAKFVADGERSALNYLAGLSAPGGVLTRSYLGTVVPGLTGRSTYVGDAFWSPGFVSRATVADDFFLGRMSGTAARAFVRRTGASFMLIDCSSRRQLERTLAPLVTAVQRFGCAAVLVLKRFKEVG
jgi:hypothetical protein